MSILARRTTLLVLAAHVLAAFLFLAPRYIRPDSVAVTSWVRSLVVDGDFVFYDEWAGFRMIANGFPQFKEVTDVGALANHWNPGAGILALPWYAVSHVVSVALPDRWFPDDGFYGLDLVTLGWSSVLFGALATLCAWSLLLEVSPGRDGRRTTLAIILAWIGTPMFWYVYRMPLGTHAAGAATIAIFVLLCSRLLRDRDVSGLLLGIVLGLCALTRIQHAVLVVPLVWVGVRTRQRWRFWTATAAGVAIPAAIQGVGWWAIYGTPLGPLTSGVVGSGTTWFLFRQINLLPVLLSPWHGLLSWSPVVALSLAGVLILAFGRRQDDGDHRRELGTLLLVVFLLELVVNATADRYWWGGMSFGPRRFVDIWIVFAIGLGVLFETRSRRSAITAAIIAALWSSGLMVSAATGGLDLSRYLGWDALARAAVVVPWTATFSSIRVPLADPGLLLLMFVALAITIGVAAAIIAAARRFGHDRVLATFLVIVLAAFVFGATRTRSRATALRERFGVNTAAARVAGPLLDRRSLVGFELEWLEATGREREATRDREEIAEIDRTLRKVGVESP